MRILIFSTAYLPLIGGAEISIKELTDRLGKEIEFDLIAARLEKNLPTCERVGKINVHRIGVGIRIIDKLLVPFFGAIKALQLNREKKYDYFWCMMVSFASGAAYIANWFQKKVPIILTLQEGDSEEWLRYRWLGLIDLSWRMALARTRVLTAISTYLLERARRLGYNGAAELVPNGVDVERFASVKHPVFDDNEIMLITTGRLVDKNGVEDVIEALKFLPVNVTFKTVGGGPLEEELKSKVEQLNLGSRVTFVESTPHVNIPMHLKDADIFIRPSLSEGQGISFIEAMAAGLPVIATPVGGIPDFIKDPATAGQAATGVFCQPHNPESIAEAVKRLIADEPLRKRLIENASKMVQEKYDWDLIAQEMRDKVFR